MEAQIPSAPAGRRDLTGRLIAGRYRLEKMIAEGGMATVFRATQEAEPGVVAIKIMHPQLAEDRSFVSRFKREASYTRGLAHPNIVRVIDSGSDGALPFLVMELLEGEDLFDLLAREHRLDERAALGIVVDLCEALAHAHGKGIVHRDLKPENVFLARGAGASGASVVKVLDFGVAKAVEQRARQAGESTPNLTMVGSVLGTPEYMSPEQCRAEIPGPRSDVYACGALLYAMLTGRPPFVAHNPLEVAAMQIGAVPEAPSKLRPELDPRIEAAVLGALAKDPDDRPASAAAFADLLRGLLAAPAPPAPEVVAAAPEEPAASRAPTLPELPAVIDPLLATGGAPVSASEGDGGSGQALVDTRPGASRTVRQRAARALSCRIGVALALLAMVAALGVFVWGGRWPASRGTAPAPAAGSLR